jgi:AraC-like DNA-binding protein
MTNATEILPGVIFYTYLSTLRKEKGVFLEHNTLVLLVSGRFQIQTAGESTSISRGEMLLVQKNQLGEISKIPLEGEDYQTIVISLKEELLREIALKEKIEIGKKYTGPPTILIPGNDFLRSYFQSVLPYANHPGEQITNALGILKIKEAVYLLMNTMPELKEFLFDFSEPHKIDLEKFMLRNFQYNIPIEKFARLTGRSLAGFKRDFQKIFGMPPRQWLLEKRLQQARHLIEKKSKKPSAIYLDLGFESSSHFSHSFKKKFGKTPTEWVV